MLLEDFYLTKSYILSKIPEETLWEFYFQDTISLNKKFKNPLRNDSNPDCTFIYGTNELIFQDWAKDKVYNIWTFVQEKYYIDFLECLKKIASDFNLSNTEINTTENILFETKKLKKKNVLLDLKAKPEHFSQKHIDYFSTYDYIISEQDLIKYNITPIEYFIMQFEEYNLKCTIKQIGFIYKWGLENKQIYQPYEKQQYKFRHKINSPVIGLDSIDFNSKSLIITKSYKDWFCLKVAGINCIAILSEKYKLETDVYMQLMGFKLYTLFDNDATGIERSDYYKTNYNTIPLYYLEVKDSYDYYKKNGLEKLKTYINNLI